MFFVRRVVGDSMVPTLRPNQLVVVRQTTRVRPGDIVVIHHHGREKIKRIVQLKDSAVWVVGDNPTQSTDSRSFGWLPNSVVRGKVLYIGGRLLFVGKS